MSTRTLTGLVAVLLVLLPSLAEAGGPWPQRKGGAYAKLSGWGLYYDQHFTATGLTDPNVTSGNYNLFFYGEYGFTDRLTGIVNAPLFARTTQNEQASATTGEVITPGQALNGIGDIDLALKYGLTKPGAAWPVSATVLFGLPTGNDAGGASGELQLGDGEFNQMLRVDAGHGLSFGESAPGYFSAYGGFNNRTNDFSDEWRAGAELGLGLADRKLWIIGRLDVVESLKNGEPSALSQRTGIFANNTEFISLGLEANVYLGERLGVSAGVQLAVRGEIIAKGTSYNVGVFYDLK